METGEANRDDDQLLLRIDPDVTRLTKLGRSTIYREIAAGRLPALRVGRAVRVRRVDVEDWLDAQITRSAQTLNDVSSDQCK
jgi:excisionase family DNA binding protein